MPFQKGEDANVRNFLSLRQIIEANIGRLHSRLGLFQAVSEAITNVGHWAYRREARFRRWWLSASIDRAKGILTVMVLDHGFGIPRTLPRQGLREEFRRLLSEGMISSLTDDGEMIEAAVALGRSNTGLRHRGRGLSRDTSSSVRSVDGSGRLRIHSNRGCYRYWKLQDGSHGSDVANSTRRWRGPSSSGELSLGRRSFRYEYYRNRP